MQTIALDVMASDYKSTFQFVVFFKVLAFFHSLRVAGAHFYTYIYISAHKYILQVHWEGGNSVTKEKNETSLPVLAGSGFLEIRSRDILGGGTHLDSHRFLQ